MLSVSQKANILAKVGIEVPSFPVRRLPIQERFLCKGAHAPKEELEADLEQRVAAKEWEIAVENLFASYTAARAAKSLRNAEQAGNLDFLRQENSGAALRNAASGENKQALG